MSGIVKVAGHTIRSNSSIEALRAGVVLVPEDRKDAGLLLDLSVVQNLVLPNLKKFVRHVFLNRQSIRKFGEAVVAKLQVKTKGIESPIKFLSGGNQQKVAFGKWLSREFSVLLLDEPTRGVDVGAKEELYEIVVQHAKEGRSVLMVSSDLEEIIGISDRVLVMRDGLIVGELCGDEISEERVMRLATGHEGQKCVPAV